MARWWVKEVREWAARGRAAEYLYALDRHASVQGFDVHLMTYCSAGSLDDSAPATG